MSHIVPGLERGSVRKNYRSLQADPTPAVADHHCRAGFGGGAIHALLRRQDDRREGRLINHNC